MNETKAKTRVSCLYRRFSLSFSSEPTQFDILNNLKQTHYSFPKSRFTQSETGQEIPGGKKKKEKQHKKITRQKSEYLGNCLLQLKKIKSNQNLMVIKKVGLLNQIKLRFIPARLASASAQPSAATSWKQPPSRSRSSFKDDDHKSAPAELQKTSPNINNF